jgi:aryl-alcohol dehydrogenase-like predicted oxidoreductase
MDYVTLGRSGLAVSPVCLGAMNFGGGGVLAGCDETEARRIIDAYLDAGGNIIDTSNTYAGGESEQIVGRAIKDRRDSVVLATKGYGAQGGGPNDHGLSRVHLTRALDDSLRRLRTDHVDLYQCHFWDSATPIEETMATLDGFVRAGKVRYLGCSNFTAAQIVEAQWAADRVGGTRFVSLQPQYSLIARDIEAEVLPTCERHGLGTLVWSPLGGGVLTGRYRRDAEPDPDSRVARLRTSEVTQARRYGEQMLAVRSLDIADEVGRVAAELGSTPTAVALAWVSRRPAVTSVIVGPRTLDHLTGNLAGFALDLPAEAVQRLDAISWSDTIQPVNGTNVRV